ncbi:hypothetical protein [Piscinibacterium candidicorallinum]|uniref:Uncharacterized protein n=1 Tax=Piscinibacterium candidicorallinum TaxID=1793872 RepID=A0ABV7H1U4_9BURK
MNVDSDTWMCQPMTLLKRGWLTARYVGYYLLRGRWPPNAAEQERRRRAAAAVWAASPRFLHDRHGHPIALIGANEERSR